ncbi:MAG: hypothetical protein DA330_03845 [Nitrososphaera sp.]|nr:hypothetical protein [Nitrososphaera sp.]
MSRRYLLSIISAILLLAVSLPYSQVSAAGEVLINEIELNPSGTDAGSEMVELYNNSSSPVDIGGWTLSSTSGRTVVVTINEGTTIDPEGHVVIMASSQWLDNENEIIVLEDNNGRQVDEVGPFSDEKNDERTWQRVSDGAGNWIFKNNTLDLPNSTSNQPSPKEPEDITPSGITGTYSDPESGLSITLPEGWEGLTLGSNLISYPGGLNFGDEEDPASITVLILNREAIFDPSNLENNTADVDSCVNSSAEYTTLNGMNTIHLIHDCNGSTGQSKSDTYAVITDDNLIIVSYSATSAQNYDEYSDDFASVLESLRIPNSENFRDALASILDLKTTVHKVELKDTQAEVKIVSSSDVSNFALITEKKQISFDIDNSKTANTVTQISIQDVLEGPHTVMVDGSEAKDVLFIGDRTTGERIIQINTDNKAHEITIIGTKVVPEFSIATIGILGAVIGAMVVLERVKAKRK